MNGNHAGHRPEGGAAGTRRPAPPPRYGPPSTAPPVVPAPLAPPTPPGPWLVTPLPGAGSAPARQRRAPRVLTVVAAVALLAAAATAAVKSGLFGAGRPTVNVSGSLMLDSRDGVLRLGSTCTGTGGYDDIHAGTQVVATDQSGTVIATGALLTGEPSDGACRFRFTVTVPAGRKFYGISVSHRGTIQYTENELRHGVGLCLGSD